MKIHMGSQFHKTNNFLVQYQVDQATDLQIYSEDETKISNLKLILSSKQIDPKHKSLIEQLEKNYIDHF